MASSTRPDWRGSLVESYPDLFGPVGDPPAAAGWPCCGDGWRDVLERACVRIRAAVEADGGTVRIVSVQEKYGTLRIDWRGAPSPDVAARLEEAVDLAEARSATTCDVCGAFGVLRGGGWLATRCAAHAEGRPAIEFEEGFENLQVERRLVGGRWRSRFRFYDRSDDRFVELGRPRRRPSE
ncbi:hypothetical protein [Bradyrhizobium sp. CSS354]|uniref:hypothetical protein n=1 Tax=Bradyrhizobium sp. CSS354 TaxID=2699172 RepID=UPI0023B0E081|nr:hypothetical protein [Bradyrhizobium sp. CSS354]MDE5465949.1 hypothetical protein [Bradyrhizobium sp. CSS354]